MAFALLALLHGLALISTTKLQTTFNDISEDSFTLGLHMQNLLVSANILMTSDHSV